MMHEHACAGQARLPYVRLDELVLAFAGIKALATTGVTRCRQLGRQKLAAVELRGLLHRKAVKEQFASDTQL
jgi:hypothetical protein